MSVCTRLVLYDVYSSLIVQKIPAKRNPSSSSVSTGTFRRCHVSLSGLKKIFVVVLRRCILPARLLGVRFDDDAER